MGTNDAGYTLDEALEGLGRGGRIPVGTLGPLLVAGLTWMGDAMEVMILSYVGPAAACQFALTPTQESALTSGVFAGMCVGALSWGALSDARGRRTAFLLSNACTVVFGFASALAPSFPWLLLGRALVGVGLSGAPVAYSYLLECVPPSTRGVWMVAIEFFWTAGTVMEACLAWALMNDYGWRWLLAASAAPLLALLLLGPFLPESPRFLLAAGRTADAQAVVELMARLGGVALPPGKLLPSPAAGKQARHAPGGVGSRSGLPEEGDGAALLGGDRSGDSAARPAAAGAPLEAGGSVAQGSSAGLGAQVAALVADVGRGVQRLAAPQLRRTTGLLLGAWFAAAFSYYGLVQLVAQLQTSGEGRSTCTAGRLHVEAEGFKHILIASAAEVPALLVAAVAVQRLGRRRSVAGAALLTAASLAPLVLGATGGAATASLFLSRMFTMACFTLLYVYTPELYPTRVRAFGLGVNNAFSRLGGLVSPFAAVNLVKAGAPRAAEVLLALASAVAAAAVACIDRETGGRALADDIDQGGSDEAEEPEEGAAGRLRQASGSANGLHGGPRSTPVHGRGAGGAGSGYIPLGGNTPPLRSSSPPSPAARQRSATAKAADGQPGQQGRRGSLDGVVSPRIGGGGGPGPGPGRAYSGRVRPGQPGDGGAGPDGGV